MDSSKKRRLILVLLLMGTLAATAWVRQHDMPEPQAVDAAKPSHTERLHGKGTVDIATNELPELALDRLARKSPEDNDDDVEVDPSLFASKSWYVPPPPPPVPRVQAVAPPAPVAPPLPFTYMGKVEDGGRWLLYLSKGENAYSVGVGETIEGTYKVESLDDGQVVFTYLPLSLKQTLKIGS